jgi:hypothetical protein
VILKRNSSPTKSVLMGLTYVVPSKLLESGGQVFAFRNALRILPEYFMWHISLAVLHWLKPPFSIFLFD